MCLAVPARVVAIEDQLASVEVQGVRRAASLMLLPEAAVGDYVLVHAGFAMQIVDEEEVRAMEALRAEMRGAPRTVEELRPH
ncbi:HypC/HybG/HupF family hydrogenase formation chaperone [Selenomonas sp. F0473]|uniref:HypC/HybG/HupF family hydrogenase formation chaperone n=1 Tax=Selenomonas sp. F0473 TaxID=999423 RepID=UPI00029E71FE|nr:HypC/HybG/HupF family hydrogenase formation chaperone [Selenomonas sp. F0473]EKU71090.1 hydrogenase assembly chaperone HypC/HupF [Selenomonas sp. F0473]